MDERQSAGAFGVALQHLSGVVIGAVVIALFATWITADLAAQWLVFPVVTVLAGYFLYGRPDDREKLRFVGYSLVAMLLVAPALLLLPDVLAGKGSRLGQTMTVVVVRLFALLAAIVAYVVYRIDGGPGLVRRLRDDRMRRALVGYVVASVLLFLPAVLILVDLLFGASTLASLGALAWRLLGVVGVVVAYATYRVDGGRGVVRRIQAARAPGADGSDDDESGAGGVGGAGGDGGGEGDAT